MSILGTRGRCILAMTSIYKTDAEIEKLLNHPKNGLKKLNVEVKIIGPGNHGNGKNSSGQHKERTLEDKADIAVLAELVGTKGAAEILNMNHGQVSSYKSGMNSSREVEEGLRARTDAKLGKISDKALEKVDKLLEIFAEDKMSELKAGEIPSAMERLVNVHEKVSARNGSLDSKVKPTVILYAPKQININEYLAKEV